MQILGEENMHNIFTKLFSLCVCVFREVVECDTRLTLTNRKTV